MADEDYVYDEDSGEWLPASELAAKRAAADTVEVRDAVGNILADGGVGGLVRLPAVVEVTLLGEKIREQRIVNHHRLPVRHFDQHRLRPVRRELIVLLLLFFVIAPLNPGGDAAEVFGRQFHGVAHNSLGNYLAQISGQALTPAPMSSGRPSLMAVAMP